ncbi:MAG: DUF1622 domain-containing protein [Thiohalocapsa sp.]
MVIAASSKRQAASLHAATGSSCRNPGLRGAFPARMEGYFKQLTLWLASGSEAAAALVIGLATIEATLRALWLFAEAARPQQPDRRAHQDDKEHVRLRLGRWLAVALEFELAADVLRTAVAPTWQEIGQLAAIIVLRTLLNFFLQKEIDKAEARAAARAPMRPGIEAG